MNVDLLRKIAAVIQEKPQEFDMGAWHSEGSCGTTHCIGGWAQILTDSPRTEKAGDMAAILGLQFVPDRSDFAGPNHASDECEAGRLFYQENWPCEFLDFVEYGERYETVSAAAAARIEHFIATEGRE